MSRRSRPAPLLRGHIDRAPADIVDAALRCFIEGMAALATRLLLEGALDDVLAEQDTGAPATDEPARIGA